LTLEQRLFYEENGYLLIRGLLKEKDLNLYRQRFIKLCDKEVKNPYPFLTYVWTADMVFLIITKNRCATSRLPKRSPRRMPRAKP